MLERLSRDPNALPFLVDARLLSRLAALGAGLPRLGGAPMKQQEAQPAEAQGQPKEEPEAKKPVVDLAAMMAAANSSDEEEEDEAADAAPQPPAAGSSCGPWSTWPWPAPSRPGSAKSA